MHNGLEQTLTGSAGSNNEAKATNNKIGNTTLHQFLDGSMGEIIIFDRALTAEEIDSIESYLGKKWGIKVS